MQQNFELKSQSPKSSHQKAFETNDRLNLNLTKANRPMYPKSQRTSKLGKSTYQTNQNNEKKGSNQNIQRQIDIDLTPMIEKQKLKKANKANHAKTQKTNQRYTQNDNNGEDTFES